MRLCILYKFFSDHVFDFTHLSVCIYQSVESGVDSFKCPCFSLHLVVGMMPMKVDPLPTHPQNFGLGKILGG